jgi:mono/diheme cytochrome c family protein
MKRIRSLLPVLLVVTGLAPGARAATIAADSARGEQLFQTLACIQCHSINGQGGKVGPDLGRRIDRSFTPATLAATMWNHAPAMWAAMQQREIRAGDLDEQAGRDLFAYFYSAHFFDKPGDAGRGKLLFSSRRCADCHGLETAKLPAAKPVSQWTSIGRPLELVNAMWNHAATMRQEFARRKFGWPSLDSQDLADMLVYLRNLPASRQAVFSEIGRAHV